MSQRLKLELRKLLEKHENAGWSQRQMAAALGVSVSTVSRELSRHRVSGVYRAEVAQARARMARAGIGPPRVATAAWDAASDKLRQRWSPEQIAARAAPEQSISAATIRRRIAEDRRNGGEWFRCLRRRGKPRLSRQQRQAQACNNIPQRVHFSRRPDAARRRAEAGHWEMDTIFFPATHRRFALLILTDRATRRILLFPLSPFNARACADAAILLLRKEIVRSITADNGGEFAQHCRVAQALRTTVFFTDPGRPQQRGTCENAVALVRDLIRGMDPASLSRRRARAIADRINNRPMKLHRWLSRNQAALTYN